MNCDDTDYEVLASQIESLLKRPDGALQIRDENTRRRLVEGARKLVGSRSCRETCIAGCNTQFVEPIIPSTESCHLVLPLAVVGVDTGVFSVLASENRPFCSTELAKKTGVDMQLLTTDAISQVDVDTYQSGPVANVLSSDNHSDSLRFTHKITAQGSSNLPDWLRSIQYSCSVGVSPTAWTSSIPSELDPFTYLKHNPWALKHFQSHMIAQRVGRKSLIDAFDFKKHLNTQDISSSTFLFVDIGGGTVLRNIEAEVYDFSTTPQPIRGARVYYMRSIFHAWADAKCVEILLNIKAGMTEQSVLMIDEIAIPETNAKGQAAQNNLKVMICVGGVERTEGQWASLLSGVGLIVHEIVKYDEDYEDALIIAGLA
ncbi:unnamed protein product [Clonostachys rhizophaga]|uniref:O-methyltransferase C-terminal domain-containing protein n=1 Tax=Clonostachys rhizophaga TaxID=160324 RepID=A0A9N9VBC1_9HYPO|nr:unnamed protein product [Clonostachys rhizophaga]